MRQSVASNHLCEIKQFLAEHSDLLARQGAIVASFRQRRGVRCGPYYRLAFRDAQGSQRSLYLGCDADTVEEVRAALARMQAPLTERRTLDRVRKQLRRSRATAQQALEHELRAVGLYLKGAEVRGWRRAKKLTANYGMVRRVVITSEKGAPHAF